VDESKTPHASRPDWTGFAVLTAGLVSLVYGLIRAGEIGWGDAGTVVCLALAGALLVSFGLVELRANNPLFDLSLFRTPTFSGGLIAAFAMNGSLFAMFVYLVLYLQDDLGYSALATGIRFLLITGGSLVAATAAGRLSSHMPVRWLIGPGLALVGVGLFLMSTLSATSTWTHLIPGFIVAGIGSGMVNPPLASTAVGVVEPQRSGMASGVNTTFRQIGIAVGIAVYGSIFTTQLRHDLTHGVSGIPGLSGRGPQIADTLQQGKIGRVFGVIPPSTRAQLSHAIHSSFAATLRDLLIVSGVLALVGAACSVTLIRSRDFIASRPQPQIQTAEAVAA
jgi:predicted MFS family arabinose efflux permease